MIDPITAFAAASAAFKGIKTLVSAGREVEDVTRQIGKWFGAVSDYQFAAAEKKKANEKGIKKFLAPQSVEQEALDYVMNKKKLAEMEKELKNLLTWGNYPSGIYNDMIIARRRIKKEREQAIHRRERAKREMMSYAIYGTILVVMLGLMWWLVGLVIDMWPKS